MNLTKSMVSALTVRDVSGYTAADATHKRAFHRGARLFLRALADAVGMPTGSYSLRTNPGGPAVAGEVTLHGERVYVQITESCIRRGVTVMFRTCNGRADYTGGPNNFRAGPDLIDPDRLRNFVGQVRALNRPE